MDGSCCERQHLRRHGSGSHLISAPTGTGILTHSQIVFDSNDRFEPYKHVCAHCAAVGNDRCIIALGYPSTSCLLCIANGVACTNKKKPAHQRRREAVLKLHVAAAAGGDRAWADKVLKEYEDAEAEAEEEL